MKKKIPFWFLGLLFINLISCETPVSIRLPDHSQTTVIEAWIENEQFPVVVISLSRPYYSKTTTDSILKGIQTEATVIVTDSNTGVNETLSLGTTTEHIYGILGKAYVGKTLKGIPGHTYLLHVENKEKIYNASTHIPERKVQIDSIYFSRPSRSESFIRILFTDPAGEFNCYRFFTKITNKETVFSQAGMGTFDDLTFDGLQLNFELTRQSYSNILNITYSNINDAKSSTMFHAGDSVCIKSCMTDPATKTFWFAMQIDLSAGSNLFLSPGTYKTNIHEINGGSVTGIWSGYNTRYDTLYYKDPAVL